ncbi:N-acetylmannosamine-6-phosphate 2-epimerase [Paenibacillus sp. 1P07SE]|uniref:N-acetylmannosamine-6-phosphate 2-epimerase n=1 Tax=Paenibacillus sp. 1P07SE TaxID=3132209 RepID=UPI0039A64A61
MSKQLIPAGGLVVSCQALEDEPLHGSSHMAAMARAAKQAGAVGIRANSLADIRAIKAAVELPVIGLLKRQVEGYDVFITPTVEDAEAAAAAGADIVAIDATSRPRPDGKTLEETLALLGRRGIAVMADVSTYEEGLQAAGWGAEYVSTTLCGYTAATAATVLPNLDLVRRLAEQLDVQVVAEGGIYDPAQAATALQLGADFVVVGSAITRPQWIASRYVAAMQQVAEGRQSET